MRALERQRSIFASGLSGHRPSVPVHPDRLRDQAIHSMSKKAAAYLQSAGKGRGFINNLEAFSQYDIVPTMLSGISDCDTNISLFGREYPTPILLAPIGVLDLFEKQGDLKTAHAATALNVPMIFSNQASCPMESCAQIMAETDHFFQLYFSNSDELVKSLISRAERCGSKAIFVTVDTTLLGWRPEDLDMAYLPFLEGMGIAQYTSDSVFMRVLKNKEIDLPLQAHKPGFSFRLLKSIFNLMKNYPGSLVHNLKSKEALEAVRLFINIYSRPSLSWDDISRLKEMTTLPVIVKGILRADDAIEAERRGVDGIVVSNHGGRQIDGVIASLDALVHIKKLVSDHLKIFFDSGIRSGTDIFKALALGADAVLVGRPYVYGLSLAGSAGVREVLNNMISELELTMLLSGIWSISEINSTFLQKKS
jgi:lactate 2-monooxygenase